MENFESLIFFSFLSDWCKLLWWKGEENKERILCSQLNFVVILVGCPPMFIETCQRSAMPAVFPQTLEKLIETFYANYDRYASMYVCVNTKTYLLNPSLETTKPKILYFHLIECWFHFREIQGLTFEGGTSYLKRQLMNPLELIQWWIPDVWPW